MNGRADHSAERNTDMDEILNDNEIEISEDALDSGWDDEDAAEEPDQPEADTEKDEPETDSETAEPEAGDGEPESETEEDANPDAKPEAEQEAGDQRFVLHHLDSEHSVTLEEMKSLAEKGLDYDRIRALNESYRKAENAHESLLQELAKHDNTTVEAIVDNLWAGLISETDGVAPAVALERAKLKRVERELADSKKAGEQTAEQTAAEERRRKDFVAFSKTHPEVKAQDIPAEVWQRVQDGMSLSDAYGLYELKGLREENTRLKNEESVRRQKEKNAARSTGSMSTSGKEPKPKFDIFAGFDD